MSHLTYVTSEWHFFYRIPLSSERAQSGPCLAFWDSRVCGSETGIFAITRALLV